MKDIVYYYLSMSTYEWCIDLYIFYFQNDFVYSPVTSLHSTIVYMMYLAILLHSYSPALLFFLHDKNVFLMFILLYYVQQILLNSSSSSLFDLIWFKFEKHCVQHLCSRYLKITPTIGVLRKYGLNFFYMSL